MRIACRRGSCALYSLGSMRGAGDEVVAEVLAVVRRRSGSRRRRRAARCRRGARRCTATGCRCRRAAWRSSGRCSRRAGPREHSFHASNAPSGSVHLISGAPSLSRKSIRRAKSRKMSRSDRASPGGSTALCERWTVRSTLVNVPVFSPQIAAGSTTSASSAVSVRKASWTTTNSRSCARISRIAVQLGQRDGRVGADDPEEADRALLGVAEDLHRVRRRRPVRDRATGRRSRAAPARRRARGSPSCGSRAARRRSRTRGCSARSAGRSSAGRRSPGLPIIPRIRLRLLTWHGRGRRLVRLVDALEDGRDRRRRRAEDLGRRAELRGRRRR